MPGRGPLILSQLNRSNHPKGPELPVRTHRSRNRGLSGRPERPNQVRPGPLQASPNATAFAALPSPLLFAIFFVLVALAHLTLLRLPYYWDEGGYYIPAALDFYHSGTLVPHFTNAHPPLPNVVLGTLWHIVGYHIVATRLLVCAFAAAALLAVFRLGERLVSATAAVAVTLLTAVYPIWFAQSTLRLAIALLFSLAALAKETSIVFPAALAALHLVQLVRHRRSPVVRRVHLLWIAALCFPLLPLSAWYGYHRHVTGFTFGNPEFLRYNATANFTLGHLSTGSPARADCRCSRLQRELPS